MKSLDKKLLRELWQMKGQALAIAMVIGSGVGTFVMSLATLESLQTTRAEFYQEYRFAEIFATLKRAPESVRERVAEIPGVEFQHLPVRAPGLHRPPFLISFAVRPHHVSRRRIGCFHTRRDDGSGSVNAVYLRAWGRSSIG